MVFFWFFFVQQKNSICIFWTKSRRISFWFWFFFNTNIVLVEAVQVQVNTAIIFIHSFRTSHLSCRVASKQIYRNCCYWILIVCAMAMWVNVTLRRSLFFWRCAFWTFLSTRIVFFEKTLRYFFRRNLKTFFKERFYINVLVCSKYTVVNTLRISALDFFISYPSNRQNSIGTGYL